jgi:hypothetical protein
MMDGLEPQPDMNTAGMGWVARTWVAEEGYWLPLPAQHAGPQSGSLGAMIGQFKSRSTKRIWAIHSAGRSVIWQRNYYEHIIRSEAELAEIRRYILNNPLMWEMDQENPDRVNRE